MPTPIPNDLSTGTTQRTVTAGAVTAVIDYWSTLTMDKWTAAAVKPLTVSMTTTVVPADGQKVYLQRATMSPVANGATETLGPLTPQSDTSTVAPGYLVLSPYSYLQTFSLGEVPDGTVSITFLMTYDFLVQTTPTSSEYAKQTVTDQLTVAIAGE